MKGSLNPSVPFNPGQTPVSFASRLARLNGIRSMREFCGDVRIPFQGLVDGCRDALEDLAELVGMSPEPLQWEATRKQAPGYILRNKTLVRGSLRRGRIYVCPQCVSEDVQMSCLPPAVAPFGRTIWTIAHIRSCPIHSVALIEIARAVDKAHKHDFTVLLEPHLDRIEALANAAAPQPVSGMEQYLLSRIDGAPRAPHWLDAMPFYAAARACEMLGLVAAFGRKQNVRSLDEEGWSRAGAAGFEIVSGGEAAICHYLDELRRKNKEGVSHLNGPTAWFGRFYIWLAHWKGTREDTAYDPLKDVIARHLIETTPVGPGDELFGKPVDRRMVHSITTAFQETGVHPTRFRKILPALGHLGDDQAGLSDNEVLFDAVATKDLLDRLSTALTLKDLAPYLNTNRTQAELAVEAGFLRPIVPGHEDVVGWHCFARRDVDAFLQALVHDAKEVDEAPAGAFTIQYAAKRACCHSTEIVQLILGRELDWVGQLKEVAGYNAVLVNVAEIKGRLRGREFDGFTFSESNQRLKINWKALKALVDRGVLKTVVQRHPANRVPTRIVPFADFERFRSRYVSLFEAARELNVHHVNLRKALSKAGIEPALRREEFHASFYLRSRLPSSAAELCANGDSSTMGRCRVSRGPPKKPAALNSSRR